MSNVIDFKTRFQQRTKELIEAELAYKESDENFLNVMQELDDLNAEMLAEIEQEREQFLEFHIANALARGRDELGARRWAQEQLQERDRWNDEINRKLGLTEE